MRPSVKCNHLEAVRAGERAALFFVDTTVDTTVVQGSFAVYRCLVSANTSKRAAALKISFSRECGDETDFVRIFMKAAVRQLLREDQAEQAAASGWRPWPREGRLCPGRSRPGLPHPSRGRAAGSETFCGMLHDDHQSLLTGTLNRENSSAMDRSRTAIRRRLGQLSERCRNAGMDVTPQRVAVYKARVGRASHTGDAVQDGEARHASAGAMTRTWTAIVILDVR